LEPLSNATEYFAARLMNLGVRRALAGKKIEEMEQL
jgi:hypothetical protein